MYPAAPKPRRRPATAAVLGAVCAALLALGSPTASGQDLQSKLDDKQAQLDAQRDRRGVLASELDRYSDQVDQLAGEVAVLRNREAVVQQHLDRVVRRLHVERDRLAQLRHQLQRSLNVLRDRLVQIYRSGKPDVLTVLLEADGFDDMISRYEYLRRIQDQDADIVGRVRTLRDTSRDTVERIEADRAEIAARKAELERTRVQLEAREAELEAARDRKAAALETVDQSVKALEGDVSHLQAQIQSQIQAASDTTTAPLPAGPIQGAEGGWIWPIDGTLTSPFGPRWGRVHEGVDIAAPEGTPIRAAKAGNVILAAYTGGYGNYTCVDHGGGLSSCYAHQSGYAVSAGDQVEQGDVIGYVGNTGNSFGAHLHFEIRVSGSAVDPLGYL